MICGQLKQCIKEAKYVEVVQKKQGKKYVKGKGKRKPISEQMLCTPCKKKECQEKCIGYLDTRKEGKCEENGMCYILENRGYELLQLHIDGGVISEPEASMMNKCDFALVVKDQVKEGKKENTLLLIELKGKDVSHAIKQIEATLENDELRECWAEFARIYGRIVCTRVPKTWNDDSVMKGKQRLLEKGVKLQVKRNGDKEPYEKLQ